MQDYHRNVVILFFLLEDAATKQLRIGKIRRFRPHDDLSVILLYKQEAKRKKAAADSKSTAAFCIL